MANKTLKQMRQLIEANHPEILGSELFTEPYLNELINNAQRDVQMNLGGLALQKFLAQVKTTEGGTFTALAYYLGVACSRVSLSAISNRLSRPKSILDFFGYHSVTQGLGTNVVYGKWTEVDRDKFFRLIRNPYGADFKDGIFIIDPTYAYLYPAINEDLAGTAEIGVNYYRLCTALTADTTALEIPEEYEHFVAKQVGIEIQAALGQIQKKDEAIQELMMKLQKSQEDFIASMTPAISNELAPMGEGAKLQ